MRKSSRRLANELKQIHSDIETHMRNYSEKYESEIKKNPAFRTKFTQLCGQIGVDPVVSKLSSEKVFMGRRFRFLYQT